jgi:hypothetical protein
VRERLDDLLGRPERSRVVRDVQVEEFAALVAEDTKTNRRRKVRVGTRKESTATISRAWVAKRAPRGRRPRRGSVHVLRDGEFGDAVAEQGQLRPNAPAAPRRILPRHASDQVAQLGVESRAADRVGPGPPAPVEPEALAVPGQHRGRLHDDETGPPARPQA